MEIDWEKMKTKIIHSIYCDTGKKISNVHA